MQLKSSGHRLKIAIVYLGFRPQVSMFACELLAISIFLSILMIGESLATSFSILLKELGYAALICFQSYSALLRNLFG